MKVYMENRFLSRYGKIYYVDDNHFYIMFEESKLGKALVEVGISSETIDVLQLDYLSTVNSFRCTDFYITENKRGDEDLGGYLLNINKFDRLEEILSVLSKYKDFLKDFVSSLDSNYNVYRYCNDIRNLSTSYKYDSTVVIEGMKVASRYVDQDDKFLVVCNFNLVDSKLVKITGKRYEIFSDENGTKLVELT